MPVQSGDRARLSHLPGQELTENTSQSAAHGWATLSADSELTILSFYLPSRPPAQQNANIDGQLTMKFTESEKLDL